jgi:hypothetical protein
MKFIIQTNKGDVGKINTKKSKIFGVQEIKISSHNNKHIREAKK